MASSNVLDKLSKVALALTGISYDIVVLLIKYGLLILYFIVGATENANITSVIWASGVSLLHVYKHCININK